MTDDINKAWTDAHGMKEIFDFDPEAGPHPDESQDEFGQRCEMRESYWYALEALVVRWIKNRAFVLSADEPIRMLTLRHLRKWGLVISDRHDGAKIILWRPTPKGIAYYFVDTLRAEAKAARRKALEETIKKAKSCAHRPMHCHETVKVIVREIRALMKEGKHEPAQTD